MNKAWLLFFMLLTVYSAQTIAQVSFSRSYNGRRLLTLIGEDMSEKGKEKCHVWHADSTGAPEDKVSLSNLWNKASNLWQLKKDTNQLVRCVNDDYDRLHAVGKASKIHFKSDFVKKTYQWATNNLVKDDLKFFKIVVVEDWTWITNTYERVAIKNNTTEK